jgi:hypothetical protein
MPNQVKSGKGRSGWRTAYYCDAGGSFLPCQVLSGGLTGPFSIFVPSLVPAGKSVARKVGVVLATSKNQRDAVHAAVR